MDTTMKTILVTGASAGIGAACVREFERRGNRVIAMARRAERLKSFKSAHVHVCACDVNDHEGVRRQLSALPEEFREIDVLVNNAGLALGMAKAQESEWQDWSTMIETNVRALTFMTHLLLPDMVKRKRGHVVNLGSVAGTYPYQGGNVYAATKAYVEQFTLALRADLHGTRVRVTNIEPGMVATDFSEVRFKGDRARADKVYEGLEALTAQDIAETVAYVVDLPERVNVNRLELMSVAQSFAGFVLDRKTTA
jgi:3-hydroxy acid dehydrogenase / malonic semialdehyde reductase